MTQTPKHIIPRVTPESKEYWDGAVRGELRIQRCTACGLHQHYPRTACSYCGSDAIEWVTASGRGMLHSYTVIRQNGVPPFDEWVPFVVGLIDLEERGARMLATMPSVTPETVRIGMPVIAEFRPANERVAFVDFRAAD